MNVFLKGCKLEMVELRKFLIVYEGSKTDWRMGSVLEDNVLLLGPCKIL